MKIIGNELHTENLTIKFHRTFRLPEDGKTYPLPRSCGLFPLKRIDDFKDKVPASWAEKGGVFMPLHQREAMWVQFHKRTHAPCAVKIGVGKINAVTGEEWTDGLSDSPQDYIVAPPQPWIDGIKDGLDTIKQFVGMPLGMGYTVEGQVTGEEKHGGLQLAVYPGKRAHFPKPKTRPTHIRRRSVKGSMPAGGGESVMFGGDQMNWSPDDGLQESAPVNHVYACSTSGGTRGMVDSEQAYSGGNIPELPKAAAMGLSAGGSMRQKIYPDPHGIEVWDQNCKQRVFVHLVNAEMYYQITGKNPPASPISKEAYFQAGIPWFDMWDQDMADMKATKVLSKVKTVGQKDKEHGFEGQQDDSSAPVDKVVSCGAPEVVTKETVRDGTW
jgi:hypothetical protein